MRKRFTTHCFDPESLYVDIRTKFGYAAGHLPGSISIPFPTALADDMLVLKRLNLSDKEILAILAKEWALNCRDYGLHARPVVLISYDSGIMAEFARDVLKTSTHILILKGGYRHYRREVKRVFSRSYNFLMLAGKTGSGKTALLDRLEAAGEQTLNIAALAMTRGSVFGRIGLTQEQPTQEQFENLLASRLNQCDPKKIIFTEEELAPLGQCHVPQNLTACFAASPKVIIQIPKTERVQNLVRAYARVDDEQLISGILQLSPRIGKETAGDLAQKVRQKRYQEVAEQLMDYYDCATGYQVTIAEKDRVINAPDQDALFKELVSLKEKRPID